eukprot:2679847-Pyramimonas_sp.AAC.1
MHSVVPLAPGAALATMLVALVSEAAGRPVSPTLLPSRASVRRSGAGLPAQAARCGRVGCILRSLRGVPRWGFLRRTI